MTADIHTKYINVIKDLLNNHITELMPIVDNLIHNKVKEGMKQLQDLTPIITNICNNHNLSYNDFLTQYSNKDNNLEIMELISNKIKEVIDNDKTK